MPSSWGCWSAEGIRLGEAKVMGGERAQLSRLRGQRLPHVWRSRGQIPWSVRAAFLRCFRALRCPSDNKWVSPTTWLDGWGEVQARRRTRPRRCLPPGGDRTWRRPRWDEARARLVSILDGLAEGTTLIQCPPGTGKSTAATGLMLREAQRGLVVYCAPHPRDR